MLNKIFTMNGKTYKRAFTLIELLLGLTIFSLVAMSVYGVFWGGMRINDRSDEQIGLYREIRFAFDAIEKDLVNMVKYDFSSSYENEQYFSVDQAKLKLIVGDNTGLKVVSYYLIPSEDMENSSNLMREEVPLVEYLNNGLDVSNAEIIAMNIAGEGLRFFFGMLAEDESNSFEWVEYWDKDDLPSHIRVELDVVINAKDNVKETFVKKIFNPRGIL